MHIFSLGLPCILFLFIGLLSFCDLSPINNDHNNQRQAHVANTIVNQPTPVILSTGQSDLLTSTNMQWIKILKNITENGGSRVVLECQVKSSYPVSFNWYRYNNPLDKRRYSIDQTTFRSSIYLNNLKESEAGFYTCEVSNGFQTLTSTGFVRVKNPDSLPSNSRSIIRPPSASLMMVLASIFIPLFLVSLLMVFLCWCCHYRNNNSHLSTCSSTSTPIKKSSHLINTVTSSPFRSSITTNMHKPNPRHIPSSSSSTNTNFTNTYLRQTLLKTESKHPNIHHHSLTENSLCEIPFTNIRFLQELGEGDYGRIYKGELIDSSNKCIIKTLQAEYATQQNREEYSREIEIFRHIHHTNISCLLGICIQPQDAISLMIYERLNDGDLHEYLLQRSTTISLYQQRDLTDFLYISIQIISGMIYLAEKNFVHNDLSAKNILISEHMDIKISNIARYRPKYDTDYYKIANRSLPVRWMAIESLLSGIYSEMSDVWSYGVLLWEMFSYGTQPYYGRTNPEVIEMIRDRKLLTCPTNCPKRIYALMCSCWEELSEQRPTFTELMKRFRQFEEKSATLSSTTSSSLIDVQPVGNQGDTQTQKYRTFMTPPTTSSFVRNDTLLSSGRNPPQSMLVDRDSIHFEV
ncbi:unnamed protein product [Rotaria sp. Silwood1]|nr:unnamed protein product [Rotaria sp. Silwood1]